MNSSSNFINDHRFSPTSNARLRWLPYAILGAAAVVLLLMWDRIPERWPTHYGLNGQPDKWAEKSPLNVFLPVGFGLLMVTFIELLIKFNLAFPRLGRAKQLSPEAWRAISSLVTGLVRLIEAALALVFAGLALMLPLVRPVRPTLVVLMALVCVGGAVIIGARQMTRGAKELKARGLLAGLEGWNGLIYRNPNDPRLWVPKIAGVGYTLNFAHRRAWWIMAAILAVPLAVILTIIGSSLWQ